MHEIGNIFESRILTSNLANLNIITIKWIVIL